MASESFSLALQQRAARVVVSEEMPRRALATRLLIFGEITSALLIIELGLFYQFWWMVFGLIIVPILLVVRMGLYVVVGMGFFAYAAVGVRWSLGGRWNSNGFFFRDLPFASVFTNPDYSSFGFRRGQKGNSLNVLTIIVTRVACAAILVYVVLNACGAKYPSNLYKCPEPVFAEKTGDDYSWDGHAERAICSNLWQTYRWKMPEEVDLCLWVKLPEWMEGTCQAGHMDALEYFLCREQMLYMEYCNAKFRVCAIFLNEASLDTFILQVCCIVPPLGLVLMVLIHLAGFIAAKQANQPSLMNMPEKQELRQRIRTKACHFEQQLQKEQLEHSIWCLGQNCRMDRWWWWWVSVNRIDSQAMVTIPNHPPSQDNS